ncbi:hypothetical protein BDB00DRAFT_930228 [Zychaea mexicana]|uniref:uncharacterized protein n=1 Tax=Zychaea mexicana TaxID=64656 RepID=UPI0022FF20C3|nr:uncharacterized protein BDB00DRAFT_930228 [Zychaea mexicana]KAI9491647.1 hypothetical protein BDB00DRAFT_930228 [Zychaea mexicana]
MSTVAMARMPSDADRVPDDSTTTTSSNAGQKQQTTTSQNTEIENNNKNAGTRKSDSGVYFAMMLSDYLEKNANELPSDHLAAFSESPKRSNMSAAFDTVVQEQQNSNTASSFSSATVAETPQQPRVLASSTTHSGTTTTTTTTSVTLKQDSDHPPEEAATAAANEAMANLSNLIWVPAHKHPQIAPSEFVHWIQVHGAAPTRKGSKVKRQKSQLSRSMSYNDALEDFDKDTSTDSTSESDSPVSPKDTDARLLPGIAEHAHGKDGHVFDRHSTVVDDSRILAPPTQNRSLLRRSAFSARRAPSEGGPRGGIGDRRRSRRPAPAPRHSTDTSERMGHVPSAEPISLHDHPVSLSEWIDLGSASLEPDDSQHGILSRVHDAESQLFSKIMDEDRHHHPTMKDEKNQDKATPPSEEMAAIPEVDTSEERAQVQESDTTLSTTTAATTTATTINTNDDSDTGVSAESNPAAITTLTDERRVTLRRSASDLVMNERVERKPSWISNLLNGDKKKKKSRRGSLRRVDDARHISEKERDTLQLTRVTSMNDDPDNKKRGFAAFISRSLSLKSITRKEPKFNPMRAKALVAGSGPKAPQNGVNGQQQQQPLVTKQYINSYRLPIHVERAVYRLSHMKLTNPRRPLHQQVLISEFMFWYLSIINPQPPQQQQQQQQGEGNQNTTSSGSDTSNTQWSSQQHHQQQQQQQQQYYQQGEANEAAALMNNRAATATARPPKFSAERRFSDDSVAAAVPRRTSQSSSDEEDNVPLSHYRK